jgi:hypothetical protein
MEDTGLLGSVERDNSLGPNGNEAWKQDAEFLDELVDDLALDLHDALPPGADIKELLAKLGELRALGKKALASAALSRASITVPAGTAEDVTVELFTDEDGDSYLSVSDKQMSGGLVRISGGRAGTVVEGRRLVYGAE